MKRDFAAFLRLYEKSGEPSARKLAARLGISHTKIAQALATKTLGKKLTNAVRAVERGTKLIK